MSIQAVGAVLKHSVAEKSARLVAISIANHADDEGIGYLSFRLVAKEARIGSRSTIRGAVEKLEELGELAVLVEAEGKTHRPPLYWLRLPGLNGEVDDDHPYFAAYGSRSELVPNPGLETDPGPGSISDPPRDRELTPPPAEDRPPPGSVSDTGLHREPSKSRPKDKNGDPSSDQIQEIYDFWKAATGRNGNTQLTEGRRRAIRARLREGRPPAFIKQAIANVAASDWHMKRGRHVRREGPPYDDIALICRNGEKLEEKAGMGGGAPVAAAAERSPVVNESQACEAWARAKPRLKALVPDSTYRIWLEPLEAAGEREGGVLVLVETTEHAQAGWTRRRYSSLILKALKNAYTSIEIVDETQLEYEAR